MKVVPRGVVPFGRVQPPGARGGAQPLPLALGNLAGTFVVRGVLLDVHRLGVAQGVLDDARVRGRRDVRLERRDEDAGANGFRRPLRPLRTDSTHFAAADRHDSAFTAPASLSRSNSAARSVPPALNAPPPTSSSPSSSSSSSSIPRAAAIASSSARASDARRRAPSADPPHPAHSVASSDRSVRAARRNANGDPSSMPLRDPKRDPSMTASMDAASDAGTRCSSRNNPAVPPDSYAVTRISGKSPATGATTTSPPPTVVRRPSRPASSSSARGLASPSGAVATASEPCPPPRPWTGGRWSHPARLPRGGVQPGEAEAPTRSPPRAIASSSSWHRAM